MCNLPGNQSTMQCNACIWSFLNVNFFPTFIHILNAACYASYIYFSDLTNLCGGIPTMQEYNIRLVWLKVPGTTACCQGYSAVRSGYLSIDCSKTTMQFTFDWGNYIDWPKIICYGNPSSTYVTWNFSKINKWKFVS